MNENLTEALADVRTALESAATAALESAAEDFDFDPAIEEACRNFDFDRAIDNAVENHNFDLEDTIAEEVKNFDFSDLASDAVKEAIDDFDIAFAVHGHIETELGSEHFALAVEKNDTVKQFGKYVEHLQRRIRALEDARPSARLRKACREAKSWASSFFAYPYPVI